MKPPELFTIEIGYQPDRNKWRASVVMSPAGKEALRADPTLACKIGEEVTRRLRELAL